jgi:hypothetical protein
MTKDEITIALNLLITLIIKTIDAYKAGQDVDPAAELATLQTLLLRPSEEIIAEADKAVPPLGPLFDDKVTL